MSKGSIEFDHSIGFNSIPNGIKVHANGTNYIYSAGGNVIIGDLMDPHSQSFLRRHDDKITALATSPLGTYIASGQKGKNSDVHVWNYDTKELIYTFEEHDKMISAIGFSHDERIVGTVGGPEDNRLVLWDMSNGLIIAVNNKMPINTTTISFGGFVKDIKKRNTENYIFCTGSPDGLLLWNLNPYNGDLESIKLEGDVRRQIVHVEFSNDGDYVYGATTTGDLIVAYIRAKRISHCIPICKNGLRCVAALNSINSTSVVCGGGDGSVQILNYNDGTSKFEIIKTCYLNTSIVGLAPSPDDTEIVAATADGTCYRVNANNMQHITISESHTDAIVGVTFPPGKTERLATASLDGTIKVWDLAEYIVVATCYPIKSQEAGAVPLCLDMSDMLVSGWSDGHVLAHDVNTGENLWSLSRAHPEGVTSLKISHNNRFFLSGGSAGEVRLWELRSRELVSHMKEHNSRVKSIVLYNNDAIALTASRDRCILRWDLRQEKRIYCNMQRMGGINDILISKDEDYILSVGQDRTLAYWVPFKEDVTHRTELNDDNDEGLSLAMSSTGKFIVTGGTEGMLRLWNYDSCQLMCENAGHSSSINSVAFSGDDRQIVSVGDDGCLFIWNLFTE